MLKRKANMRSVLIGAIFILLFFIMLYQLYTLQVAEAVLYQERAERMWENTLSLPAQRGDINDRNGSTLVREVPAYTVVAVLDYADPDSDYRVQNIEQTASKLAPVLEMTESELIERMSATDRYQVELRPGGWKIDQEKMEQIKALELEGIRFIDQTSRTYMHDAFASHVLGFLNRDDEPLMGVEHALNEYLEGEDGSIQFRTDNSGERYRLPDGVQDWQEPRHGNHVYVTIDERIQLYVEEVMDDVQNEYDPEWMSVIVSDPNTGEILAMSNRPDFNPNDYATISSYENHAVSSIYEPGSTFKIVPLAAAIEHGQFQEDEMFMSGSYQIPGTRRVISEHNRVGWGEISFLEGVQRSSNVLFAKLVSERLETEQFYDYIKRFGFGSPTNIDLPRESSGTVLPMNNQLSRVDVASMAFGHAVAVTPIQQIAAINAIANGGKLMQPYIVDRIVDAHDEQTVYQNEPLVQNEHVITNETAARITDLLETVVTDGTGSNFYIDGYRIAGKTGTAQKYDNDGVPISGQYVHSFLGYAPADDPKISMLVTIDTPKVESYTYGSAPVAQIFKHVMENTLQYYSVFPEMNQVPIREVAHIAEGISINDYEGYSLMQARREAEADGLSVVLIGNGSRVKEQYPRAGEYFNESDSLYLISDAVQESIVPNMEGWSLRDVQTWASLAGIDLETEGNGYVQTQSVTAEQSIRTGERLTVTLSEQ